MSETARRMLIHGVAAAQAGDTAEARRYLERVLYHDADRDQRARAHLWLSRVASSPAEQREHLEEVLAADPMHGEAIRALAILDGKLDPADIVDPDHLPEASGNEQSVPQPIAAQRMVCPQCAGSIRFEPGESWVVCQYCGHRQTILDALKSQSSVKEEDFVLALATAKGHMVPSGLHTFRCKGCQAALMTSGEISTRCPYCGSPHVVEVESQAAIPPEGIVPFRTTEGEAQRAFVNWLREQFGDSRERLAHVRTTRVRGVYLPMWTFDLMGEVGWRGTESDQGRKGGRGLIALDEGGVHFSTSSHRTTFGGPEVHEGTQYVLVDDAIVPASRRVPFGLRRCYEQLDLSAAVPYHPGFLSDWPAETYEIAAGDASLVARSKVVDDAEEAIRIKATVQVGELQNLQTYSKSLAVQSYKLLLVPMWLANYRYEDKTYASVVNGQTGEVSGEKPPNSLKRALQGLLGLGS